MNVVYAILATIAGIIFFYVLIKHDDQHRASNTVVAIVAAVIDTYPAIFGSMARVTNLAGVVHGIITAVAYMIFICWLISYDKKLYYTFLLVWVIAYTTGYIAAIT